MLLPEHSFIHLGYNRIDAVAASTLPHYLADELKQVRATGIDKANMCFA